MKNKKNKSVSCEGEIYHDKTGIYDVCKIRKLSENSPTVLIPLSNLKYHLKEKEWGNYSIQDVLKNPDKYPEDIEIINSVDLSYPILEYKDNIIDGNHRLAKAFLDGKENIKVKQITKKQMEAAKDRVL